MKKKLQRGLKRLWILSVTVVVILAISLTVFRALTPWAAQYKGTVETRLSTLFGTQVQIKEMKTSWYWFQPVLKLDGIKISKKDYQVLNIDELLVGIDLVRSFLHWRIQPGVLFVEDATFNFKEDNTRWQLDGVALNADIHTVPHAEYTTVLGWLLAHQKIVMKRVALKLHWKDGRVTAINPLNLDALHRDGHYRVKGKASLLGKNPSVVALMADFNMPAGFSSNVRGQVYLSAERIHFADWHRFFSHLNLDVTEGLAEGQLWLDIQHSRIVSAQSVLRLRDVVWQQLPNGKPRKIDRFSANMAFENRPSGWKWSADHVRFKANKINWPENELAVTYQEENASYQVFVKTLLIEPARALLEKTPEMLSPLLAMKPKGQLNHLQLAFEAGKLNYVLSHFSHLSWEAKDSWPAVRHLSGAIAFEPKEGHLDLEGEQVGLQFKNKPPLELALLNASLTWKALSHGWRVNLDRGIVEHKQGVLSGRGMLDGIFSDNPLLQTRIAFTAHDATFWWPYLPEHGLKPKFKQWMTHDVTKLEQLSGRIQIKGPLKDFPFDKPKHKNGDFVVTGSMNGLDLRFNPKWPLTKNIAGTFRLDKRLLTADISEANFEGIPMKKAHLTVRDLGVGHEVLDVQGQIEAPLEAMQAYIQHSPLHAKLSKLDGLRLKQPAKLDLGIRFPFYPEHDKLTLDGTIAFDQNDLFLKDVPDSFALHALKGPLAFTEQGVADSHLSATLFNEPVTLDLRSHHGDAAYLAIDLKGHLSVLGLRETAPLPVFGLLRGRAPMQAEIKITDEPNDLDELRLTSSLEGVEIDLPAPFGKARGASVPLAVDMYFNLARGIRLKVNCDQRLNTDLWFSGTPSGLSLARGEVVLGAGEAILRDKPGASIRGTFDTFDWSNWQIALDKLKLNQNTAAKDYLPGFRAVSLRFKSADIFQQHYEDVKLYAERLPEHVWALAMRTNTVSADLKYSPDAHLLTGSVSSFKVDFNRDDENKASHPIEFNPKVLPNLRLNIEALEVGDVNAGALSLKGTHVSDAMWRLDAGELKSDAYALTGSGAWQSTPKPETTLDAILKIHNLDKALVHWGISPAIEAHEGVIRLMGDWDGAPTDFSVKGFTGKMHMMFKEGRIPNLSPETEKKMALGKLLSILSLQTIPRRLKLDFSDLAKPGYSFDKFDGNFVLAHGIMETEDSAIDGPVARATMKGSLNLDKQLYDLSLHIMPHITASLPVVATIAGGPIAGVATWVASKLINQGMEKISGYTYEVSGPWREPVVQQVHIYKKH